MVSYEGDLQWGAGAMLFFGSSLSDSGVRALRENLTSNVGIPRLSAYRIDQNDRDIFDPIFISPGR